MTNFLSIDQGTTSSRAVIYNEDDIAIYDSQKEYSLDFPNDGWVEADPSTLLQTVNQCLDDVLRERNIDIISCGITNQRETTIVWSKDSGIPIYPAIVWQDRRTNDLCESMRSIKIDNLIKEKTGLILDPYFSATKIKWILDNVDGARKKAENGELLFGTVDTFLIYNLTSEKNHFTDITNASRTMLFNIVEKKWDEELLKLFDIPISMMPKVKSCDAYYGTIKKNDKKIPINGVIGDQQSALVGQGCFQKGDIKSTYGTGCFLIANTGDEVINAKEGLLTTIGYELNNEVCYALEGSIYSCGTLVKWLRDEMKLFNKASESENFMNKNWNSNNVLFLPALNGLGAPYWNSEIRGGFYGITQSSSKNDLITAVFKSICFQTLDIVKIFKKYDISINQLAIDGGMVNNKSFCQMLSDIIQTDVFRPTNSESTALGACKVAKIGSGLNFKDEIIDGTKYCPNKSLKSIQNEDFSKWVNYIDRSIKSIK